MRTSYISDDQVDTQIEFIKRLNFRLHYLKINVEISTRTRY